MSLFLGPIHHWLFNKILLFQDLEKSIISNTENELNINIKDMVNEIRNVHGQLLEDKPLEELIDEQNIHNWLHERISECELRHAELVTKLLEKHKDEAFNIIKKTYENQALICADDAKTKSSHQTPNDIFTSINNYILDGMPCDNVKCITINEDNLLQWKVEKCLHKKYWDKINGDINVFYKLRAIWISQFVKNINPSLSYIFQKSEEERNKNTILINEIKK